MPSLFLHHFLFPLLSLDRALSLLLLGYLWDRVEFLLVLLELLLSDLEHSIPDLLVSSTAVCILQVRHPVLDVPHDHGWVHASELGVLFLVVVAEQILEVLPSQHIDSVDFV